MKPEQFRKKKESHYPYYGKFYLSDSELENLNRNYRMSVFSRSAYLRMIMKGIQVKENYPPELNDFVITLKRLYSDTHQLENLCRSTPGLYEYVRSVNRNMGDLDDQIIWTLGISDRKFFERSNDEIKE